MTKGFEVFNSCAHLGQNSQGFALLGICLPNAAKGPDFCAQPAKGSRFGAHVRQKNREGPHFSRNFADGLHFWVLLAKTSKGFGHKQIHQFDETGGFAFLRHIRRGVGQKEVASN